MRRCYFHEGLDRPGVYVRTGYPKDDPTYDRLKGYLSTRAELKDSWACGLLQAEDPIEIHMEPCSEDWDRRVYTLHTPAGDLRATRLMSRKGLPGMDETHFLKSREDAEKYLSLPLPKLAGDAEIFFEKVDQMGNRGIVGVNIGRNPGSAAAQGFGSELFALMTVTDRDIVHAICEHQMKLLIHQLKYALQLGIGPYFAMAGEEFIVPPLHGPKDFHDFNFKYDKPIIDLIHNAGGRIHIHCHGSIRKVFREFVNMGVDVLHPFEAPPMGDITPIEAKQIARGRMTLEGNIQIASMYDHTPEQIREETQQLIADTFDDKRGLIVCPTASPYQRGDGEKCFEQFKAMVDTVLGWKG